LFLQRERDVRIFADKFAVQLNDTHPALAVPELMRLLVDDRLLGWEEAWDITTRTFGYTNHTLLPEALETWSLPLFQRVLPRHLEIIYEINERFLDQARRRFPNDQGRISRLSLIDESGDRRVRMANLACVGSHAINGVAELHSKLLASTVLADFAALWPEKFTNVTNGVTPRRFLLEANPLLAKLISSRIGDGWARDLGQLAKLEPLAEDRSFRDAWRGVKLENKRTLSDHLGLTSGGGRFDPESMFDVQAKRFHEYKRQHLLLLWVIARYRALKQGRVSDPVPRTVLLAGKAAPAYFLAKLIIKLAHSVAEVVNQDEQTRGVLRVGFVPDFNVKNAQRIYPAADLSEQISLAGKEASGTGNMKFALNGALTIGTLDGANVEIRAAVGADNFFLFGMTAEEADQRSRSYRPRELYESDPTLHEAIDLLASGAFSRGDRAVFEPLVGNLLHDDPFMVLADFAAYSETQRRVDAAWKDRDRWTRVSILNVARMGRFSSDRAIQEYCEKIWHTGPMALSR
jgi:starch phosphorylase